MVAAVFVDAETLPQLLCLGVRDGKRLADSTVLRLAEEIRSLCPHDLVQISPRRYNELQAELGNLNRLLAWGHARAIENLLGGVQCSLVVADQFGDESFLRSSLMARGKSVRLCQQVHGESDPAVAAASIVARAAFLQSLEALSRAAGVPLPKGATQVLDAARQVLEKGGEELLRRVAKVHFRTTRSLRAPGANST